MPGSGEATEPVLAARRGASFLSIHRLGVGSRLEQGYGRPPE